MQISLDDPLRKTAALLVLLLATGSYLAVISREAAGAYFAAKENLAGLSRAAALQPGNAEYQYREGRYLWLVQHSPLAAVQAYRSATQLNPHKARYWFELATAYQVLGKTDEQREALEHAIQADPTTPEVAWEAANLYIVEGEMDKALKEFRVVLQNDPYLPPSALQLCWRIKPDIDALLRDVVPPMASVESSFLEVLISRKETVAAAKVWARMAQLQQPVQTRYVFEYIEYLISQQQIDQARLVWQQAANTSGLASYQPSSENLVVNGDFSLNVLNGGFDWQYYTLPEVSLALDPTQPHLGGRSLEIKFDSRGLDDAGIRQPVPVKPNTTYHFSAYFKAEDMEGAGGPAFVLQDWYKGTQYFASENLKDADFWKQVGGDFTTGPDTNLLLLHIQRVPQHSPIKGKLWVDGVRLVPVAASQESSR